MSSRRQLVEDGRIKSIDCMDIIAFYFTCAKQFFFIIVVKTSMVYCGTSLLDVQFEEWLAILPLQPVLFGILGGVRLDHMQSVCRTHYIIIAA